MSSFQSGFRPNFSTTTALMKITNDLFISLNNCEPADAIFIDLFKAFDMVDHYLFLDNIQSFLQLDFKNKLVLNKKKSCSRVFIKRCHGPHSFDLNISFEDGSLLSRVDLFKYLGIWLDPELCFKHHIDSIIKNHILASEFSLSFN